MTTQDNSTIKADKYATWSLILELCSFLCLCFTALPAIVLGALALPNATGRGRTRAIIGMTAGVGMTMVMLIIGVMKGPERGETPEAKRDASVQPETSEVAAAAVTLPEDQEKFCAVIQGTRELYEAAANDLQRSKVRGDRRRYLLAILAKGQVSRWTGQVSTLTTTGDGKAIFEVDLPCGATLGTWNNALSDIMSDTLIEQSSQLFGVLSELEVGSWRTKGSRVRFSGSFLVETDRPDGYAEKSLTERGSMTSPAFVFRFSTVEPF